MRMAVIVEAVYTQGNLINKTKDVETSFISIEKRRINFLSVFFVYKI